MGKLHTLKKSIERNPSKWYWKSIPGIRWVWGAYFMNNQWYTTSEPSYKRFIAKVLYELTGDEFKI